MDDTAPNVSQSEPSKHVFVPILASLLILAVLVFQGYQAWIAFDRDDTNHLETPLLLATARQLLDGPSTLYGPFSGTHPLVLIHAPLYYRVVGLAAWPLARMGMEPVVATMIAGRLLSMLGLLGACIAAWKIARIDGETRAAGLFASCLIASSPVFGSFGVTIRPDTLALAFQTAAFGLVLKCLRDGTSASWWSVIGSAFFFGLAACVKQHLIVAAGVSALLLIGATIRGQLATRKVVAAFLVGIFVIVAYYSAEEFVTKGMMSKSVFLLPAHLRETVPASWDHVQLVFWEVAKRGVGELVLGFAIVLVAGRGLFRGTWIDGVLVVVFVAETAAMVPLCLASEGAFVNYAMPSVVWASILFGRALSRIASEPKHGWKRGFLVFAGLVLVARGVQLAEKAQTARQDDRGPLRTLLTDPAVAAIPPSQRYFVHLPQHNRMFGAVDLAHDEWLIQSYEKEGMIDPRSHWLKDRLSGPSANVNVVVVPVSETEDGAYVPGIPASLPALGYRLVQQFGRYAVWIREPLDRAN